MSTSHVSKEGRGEGGKKLLYSLRACACVFLRVGATADF